MQPVAVAHGWSLPRIENLGELAQWLSIPPEEVEWFADLKALGNKLDNAKLQHYRYRIIRKRSGRVRVIESPKPRLKEMQRRILAEILDRLPVHPAVHGFVKGRSIVTFAEALAVKSLVLRIGCTGAGFLSHTRLSRERGGRFGRYLHECGASQRLESPAARH